MILNIETGTLAQIFGDDAWLMNEVERASNAQALAAAFDAAGGVHLTPWQMVALAQVTYISTRLVQPKTREKIKPKWNLLKAWVINKWHNFTGKRKNGAHTDSGDKPKRENNPSGENGGALPPTEPGNADI